MSIDLYYTLLSPPARSVLVLAKYLGIDLNLKSINLMAGEHKSLDFLKLNPSHTVPTLVDNGFALFESRAILQYLCNKYAPNKSIYPSEAQARASVDKILFYDASAFFPALRAVLVPKFRQKIEPPQQAVDELNEKVQILEALLGEQKFVTGDSVTIADISLGVSIPFLKNLQPEAYTSKLDAWYVRLGQEVPQLVEYNNQALELLKEMLSKQ